MKTMIQTEWVKPADATRLDCQIILQGEIGVCVSVSNKELNEKDRSFMLARKYEQIRQALKERIDQQFRVDIPKLILSRPSLDIQDTA